MSRNSEILEAIEAKRLPILPFELEFAQRAFQSHIARQNKLGKQLGEAMSQTSETWHDNAAADAVASDSVALAEAANYTRRIIEDGEVFSYEAELTEGVTLGSLVNVRFDSSDKLSHIYITGSTRELSDEIEDELPDVGGISVATIYSPIGQALLGVKLGESTNFKAPNGRNIELRVEDIQQVTLPIHAVERAH